MKKKVMKIISWVLVISLSIVGIRALWLHSNYAIPNKDYFGKRYDEIFHITGIGDRVTAKGLMDKLQEAFSFVGTEAEAEERFGTLGRYSVVGEADEIKAECKIQFISADFDDDKGVLWFSYSQKVTAPDGEIQSASADILTRTALEKVNGEWVFAGFLEHP